MKKIDTSEITEYYMQVREYFDTILVGEEKAKDIIVSSLLCDKDSKILITGLPGTAKSTLSNSLARILPSRKISITSDLIPSDLIKALMKEGDMELLQLEELNRGSGKFLSSLIEVLADRKISTDEKVKDLKDFYAIATQNDSEIAGIFDVPQAIYDRFDVHVSFGNLTLEELEEVIFDFEANTEKPSFDLESIINFTSETIRTFEFSKADRKVFMDAVMCILETEYEGKYLFASSNVRGFKFAKKIALLHAMLDGRKAIFPDDISDYIESIFLHRIDQNILKMNDVRAKQEMKTLENKILTNVKRL